MREVLTQAAKRLRKDSTFAERKLWHFLRTKQFSAHKFRRQEPIGRYVVDFVSCEVKVVIELDGGQHAHEQAKDQERDQWLESQGFKVLRFWNNDIMSNMTGVLEIIRKVCFCGQINE